MMKEQELKNIFKDILRLKQVLSGNNFRWASKEDVLKYTETLKSLVKALFPNLPVRLSGSRPETYVPTYKLKVNGKVLLSNRSTLKISVVLDWGELKIYGTLEKSENGIPDKTFYEWKVESYEDLKKVSDLLRQLKIRCSLLD